MSKATDRIPLAEARTRAAELVAELAPACERIEIAGSIRRHRPTCGDIDIVLIPKFREVRSGLFDVSRVSLIDDVLKRIDGVTTNGAKIKGGTFRNVPFDLYIANSATWATLLLIRTGSAAHNIMLCKRATDRRMKLHANGDGITDSSGRLIQCDTEQEVFTALGLDYVEPQKREC